ncbi:MAG: saccharopine dehydrogenase C-terminal domain-containing protein [Nanoarchaeota archaeon]
MRYDFAVIGATGMQGKIVTKDLLKSNYSVLLCGRDKSRVEDILKKNKNTAFAYLDLREKKDAQKIIEKSGARVVINCAEREWNLNALEIFIAANVHSIDLGSSIPMLRKQLAMKNILAKKGLIHITGCGSVPGIGNVMLNYAAERFDTVDSVKVGFAWDSNMKRFVVPFSISSILEEFTADAPYLHHHKTKIIKPMKSVVRCYHRAVGRENQFKVGHHPETYTFHKFLEKKGIANVEFYAGFPDHSMRAILLMIELGFGGKPLEIQGVKIEPDIFLAELLKRIEMPKGYQEIENLWVTLDGKYKGKRHRVLMECIVPPLKGWESAGSNVDTGMPASIIAQMIHNGIIKKAGSWSPEEIVPPDIFFMQLARRCMHIFENGKKIN